MSKGIIYLIQPAELVKTNRYKIGCSKSPNLDRCKNGYKKGSRYIIIMECNNPHILEKNIKDNFNKLFKLIAGNEYFEGDENIMKETFLHLCKDGKIKNINEEPLKLLDMVDPDGSSDGSNDGSSDVTITIYEISTYEDFILSSDIEKIIITNKTLMKGYLKYKGINKAWMKINEDEPLLPWLENNQGDPDSLSINIDTDKLCKTDITNPDYNKIYKNINIEFNYNKIIDDICKKCYNKNIQFYNFKYNEYLIYNHDTNYHILDTINLTYTGIDCYNTIILYHNATTVFHINNFETINTNIVNDILKTLIIDNNILIKYKRLCYNIIVEQREQIIFYDYYSDRHLLSTWLNDMLYAISSRIDNYYDNNYIKYHYDKDYIKIIKKYKPRVVFINYYNQPTFTDKQIKKIIIELGNLGIKNIIICEKNYKKNMYNHSQYIEYIVNNRSLICDNVYSKDRMGDFYALFEYKDLLFTNYLKWCYS